MKICVLATGSEGNSFFISSGRTKLLVDCGISRPMITDRLVKIGENPALLDAVLITHEHGDHTNGLRGMVGKFGTPIHVPWRPEQVELGCADRHPVITHFTPERDFRVGDMLVSTLRVPHDAAASVAYRITDESGASACVMTDLGYLPEQTVEWVGDAGWLFVESNHDVDMLAVHQDYQEFTRTRIYRQHLNNTQSFELAKQVAARTKVVMGHISRKTNDVRLIRAMGSYYGVDLTVAAPGEQTEVFHL